MILGFSAATMRSISNVPVEYLIVAGGAGSGNTDKVNSTTPSGAGGGGGAGGLLQGTLEVVKGITQSITVGAGGSSAVNGSDSVFGSLTAIGGGGGGAGKTSLASPARDGKAGGSGGGGGGSSGVGGAGTAGQGYKGGRWEGTTEYLGAGSGGGAGGASTRSPAEPGPGLAISISGTSTTYATGGYVGNVRLGTSANTPPTGAGTAGAANTGEGGDGRYLYYTSGGAGTAYSALAGLAGGSGIVILRYPISYNQATATTGSPTYTTTSEYHIYTFTGSGSITF